MGKGAIALGIVSILFGVYLLFSGVAMKTILVPALLCIGLGIALIICWKEEDIIEQRKDLKPEKPTNKVSKK